MPTEQISKIASVTEIKTTATGRVKAGGCLSMTISVTGAGTTFNLYAGGVKPLTELDAPINFPYYDKRNSRRWDDIPFERVAGAGSLVVIKDQDLNCQN